MHNKFLSQVEKNIEIQAAGLIAVAREDRVFSEARGELAQLNLADRLRARVNESIYFQIEKWDGLRVSSSKCPLTIF